MKAASYLITAIIVISAISGPFATAQDGASQFSKEDNAFAAIVDLKKKFEVQPFDYGPQLNSMCLQYLLRYTEDSRTPEVAMFFIDSEQAVGFPPFSNRLSDFNKKIAAIVIEHPDAKPEQIDKAEAFNSALVNAFIDKFQNF